MRLLPDKNITWDLRPYLQERPESVTAARLGWDRLPDGELIARARNDFDALITCDQSIPPQQNIRKDDVGVVVLVAKSNSIVHLRPLLPKIFDALDNLNRGEVVYIQE